MIPPEILAEFRDIEGLQPVSIFPLAPVWWLAIALTVTSIIGFFAYRHWQKLKKRRWQYQALQQLDALHKRIVERGENSGQATKELAELFKRIVLQRATRKECAGLTEDRWIDYLMDKDPKGYNWKQHRRFWNEIIYAPPDAWKVGQAEINEITTMIHSIRAWIKA